MHTWSTNVSLPTCSITHKSLFLSLVAIPAQLLAMAHPTPKLNLEERINQLYPIIDTFKETHEVRIMVYNLSAYDGLYCATCSPRKTPGDCGPTCPLLRPEPEPYHSNHRHGDWQGDMVSDYQLYRQIVADMAAHAAGASENRVIGWERATRSLRRWSQNNTEKHEDDK